MADRAGRVADVNGPEAWFRDLPLITRFWFGGTILITCCANFNIVSVYKVIYMWQPLKDNFEVWRLITPFCYAGQFSLPTLFALYMLVHFSQRYESTGPYNTGAGGGTADYLFALLFAMFCILLTYPFFKISPIFTSNLTYFVIYIYSKKNPDAPANIWGVPVKTLWLPFVYLALNVLLGNSVYDILHGIAIGHAYYFLVHVVPIVYGKHVLVTPHFLIDYFGVGEYVPPVQPVNAATGRPMQAAGNNTWSAPGRVNPPNDPTARRTGHNWGGGGRVLGTN